MKAKKILFILIATFIIHNLALAQNLKLQTEFVSNVMKEIEKQEKECQNKDNDFIQAERLFELGKNYQKITEYKIAIDYFQKSYEILKNCDLSNTLFAANLLSELCVSYHDSGDYKKSLDYGKISLGIYERLKLKKDEKTALSECYNHLAWTYGALDQYDECFHAAEQALLLNESTNDIKIDSYHVKGHYLCFKNQFKEGIPLLEKSLEMKDGVEDLQAANIYASLTNANRNNGDLYKAIQYANKEVEIYENYYGIENIKTAGAYRDIGTVYSNFGDYERAVSYIEKAIQIFLDQKTENGDGLSYCYNNLGVICVLTGEPDKALENLTKSLELNIKQYGEVHSSVATCYNNIAVLYFDLGNIDKALEYQNKTVEIDTMIFGEKSPKCLIDYLTLAYIYNRKLDKVNAEKNYLISLEIGEKDFGKYNPFTADIYMQLGHFYINQIDEKKAYSYYKKGLLAYRNSFANYNRILINVELFLKSVIRFDYLTPPTDLVQNMLDLGIEKIERAMIDNPDLESSIHSCALPLYYYGVKFKTEQNNFDKAFEYSEMLRKRAYLEQIGNEAALKLDALSEQEKDAVMKLQTEISFAQSKIQSYYEIPENERDNKSLFDSIKILDESRKKLEKLNKGIATRIPAHQEFVNPKTVKAKDAKKWCGKNRAIIEYVFCEENLLNLQPYFYCIILDKKSIKVFKLDSSYDYDSSINSLFEFLFKQKTHSPMKSEETFEKQRNELYEKLVKPILPYIKGKKDLLIIPDENLRFLSFKMLRENKDSDEFGAEFSIDTSPSVSFSIIADKVK